MLRLLVACVAFADVCLQGCLVYNGFLLVVLVDLVMMALVGFGRLLVTSVGFWTGLQWLCVL